VIVVEQQKLGETMHIKPQGKKKKKRVDFSECFYLCVFLHV